MSKTEPKIKSWWYATSFIWEIAKIVIISLAIIIPIRYFLFQPFFVRGASMYPTFEDGEYLIINEIGYRLSDPDRGDVIVFKYPKDTSQYYIKRVIGLPGETVQIKEGSVVIFNKENPTGFSLDETEYLNEDIPSLGNLKMNLDENDYFVLGDNRQASSDSRRWGAVPRQYIIGEAWVRAWPFNRVGIVN